MAVQSTVTVHAPPPVSVRPAGARRVDIDELQYLTQRLLDYDHGKVFLERSSGDRWVLTAKTPDGKKVKRSVPFLPKSGYKSIKSATRAVTSNPFILYRMFGPGAGGNSLFPTVGPYDGLWCPLQTHDVTWETVQWVTFYLRKTDYVSSVSFRYTLNTEDDPVIYLRKAKLFYSAGIENTREYENRIVEGLKEILRAKSLKDVSHLLIESKYEDLTDLKASYRTLLNRTLPQIASEISSDIRTVIRCDSALPPELQQAGYILDETLNPMRFVYKNNLTVNAQDDLKKANVKATAVVRANLNKMEHQLITLETPEAGYERHPDMNDPANNPFLVYNAEASEQQGEVIFENVAKNKNIAFRSLPKYVTGKRYSLDIFRQTPAYRESQRTYYDPETGKVYGGTGGDDETKESILPWVAGGILAAYGVSQVI